MQANWYQKIETHLCTYEPSSTPHVMSVTSAPALLPRTITYTLPCNSIMSLGLHPTVRAIPTRRHIGGPTYSNPCPWHALVCLCPIPGLWLLTWPPGQYDANSQRWVPHSLSLLSLSCSLLSPHPCPLSIKLRWPCSNIIMLPDYIHGKHCDVCMYK